ncbi:hypothetical protein GALL_452170 [mine drainage metagenome]|uniref:Uncharacterized protein n=1 Tax=mine drainage metagenome TaxID=410659 RepID=A0A1J5PPT0_9ZZZZ
MQPHILTDISREPLPRRRLSDLHTIVLHAADALGCYVEAAKWHRRRAVARGLKAGAGAKALKVASRRAERLADALNALVMDRYEFTIRDWQNWLRRDCSKVSKGRRKCVNAAECDFWNAGADLETPEFCQAYELDHMEGMYAALTAFAFAADAIKFYLLGFPPTGHASIDRWLTQVAEQMASLHRDLAECGE